MTEAYSLFDITATLPQDFYVDSEIPFDATHGLSLVHYQQRRQHHPHDSEENANTTNVEAELLEYLPPYHYSQSEDETGESTPQKSPQQSWTCDFEKKGLLGVGGEGKVHNVQQHSLQREVAVKSLHSKNSSKWGPRKLLDEAQVMGLLEHPNVIPVHILGRDLHGNPFLVMKKVEGDTWKDLIRDPSHEGWERLRFWSDDLLVRHLEILMQICNALEHAHSRGIIHRDIKPSNVMVGEFGEVYLLDWGLALFPSETTSNLPLMEHAKQIQENPTRNNVLCGTPMYMAPEMFLCAEELMDARTDVYLLGALLFELLFQRPPHTGATLLEYRESALRGPTFGAFDEALEELVDVCQKALSIEPANRFQDVESFRKAVASFLRHQTSTALFQQARTHHRKLELALEIDTKEGASALYDLFTEARFGYLQALQEWPDNQRAISGYQRCLELMMQFHIKAKRLTDAEALKAQLPEQNTTLNHQFEALKRELESQENQREVIQQLRFELDSSLSHKERMIYIFAIGLPTLLASLVIFLIGRKTATLLTTHKLLWLAFFVLGIFLVLLLLGRRYWTKNTFDKRFLYFSMIIICAICFHRWLAYMLGQNATEVMIVDLCIAASVGLTGGIFFRPLIIPGTLSGILSVIALFHPSWTRELFNVYACTVFCLIFVLYKRSDPKQSSEETRSRAS